eukprot:g34683.t1
MKGLGPKRQPSCSSDAAWLAPLHELVVEAGSKGHEEEIILGLKAIGNAGQLASLKRIQKFLPGFGNVASGVSSRVHAEAVMALRNIAKKEPRKVREDGECAPGVIRVQVHNSLEVATEIDRVIKKAYGMLAFIGVGIEYKSQDVTLHLYKTL